jgi:hypothetical protein
VAQEVVGRRQNSPRDRIDLGDDDVQMLIESARVRAIFPVPVDDRTVDRKTELVGQHLKDLTKLRRRERLLRRDDKMAKGVCASEAPCVGDAVFEVSHRASLAAHALVFLAIFQMRCQATTASRRPNARGFDNHGRSAPDASVRPMSASIQTSRSDFATAGGNS